MFHFDFKGFSITILTCILNGKGNGLKGLSFVFLIVPEVMVVFYADISVGRFMMSVSIFFFPFSDVKGEM